MIIDSHSHYNLDPFYEDWQMVWKESQDKGVTKSIVVGTDLDTSQKAIKISQKDKNLLAAIGIHPNSDDIAKFDQLDKLFAKKSPIVAVGETGLDYFRVKDSAKEEVRIKQIKSFIAHIKLAQKHEIPLIIHVRDKTSPESPTAGNAYWDTLIILKEYTDGDTPFILHCVSGPRAYLAEAMEMGAYIGLAGNVTYPNADNLRELIKLAPKDRLLLETDAPFLPPQEFRGQTCEPWMITKTAEFVTAEFKIDRPTLIANTQRVFELKNS